MKRICSWCGVVIEVGSTQDAIITHSICKICMERVEKQITDWARAKDAKKTEQ